MAEYTQTTKEDDNGYYEVHHCDCPYRPILNFTTFEAPYQPADGCYFCMKEQHIG